MTSTPQTLIERYFALAADPDREADLGQFAADTVVEDEGHEHHGIDAVRAWRGSVPEVTYTVRSVEATPAGHRARTGIAGDFPGSPVELTFDFAFDGDDRVTVLRIRP